MAIPKELGRYELLIELGHGGMAELFLGRLHGAGGFAKLVAIKRILPHLARDAEFTAMFLDEGRIASRLSHPNVCQVFELDDANGELFLAMEYLDGVPWGQMLPALPLGASHASGRRAAPPLQIAAGVLAQAADGLHYAHSLRDVTGAPTPVIHRDVSPQNLFVTIDGVCKVLDFGVAKMMTDGPRTKSGVVKGKLPYMAPEQIRGEPVDARTDVFSLGVCLWEALAGERLYDRATDFLIWKAVTEEDAPAITTRWPGCPPAVAAVTRRALAREPADRLPSARAFADELRAAVPDLATTAQLGDALRAACADRIAARQQQVAAAITSRTEQPEPGERGTAWRADGRRSHESMQSAAATLESGRSAAMTLDDKPMSVTAEQSTPSIDPGMTADLRSGSKRGADVQLRDRSMVVTRDSDLEAATTIPRKPLSQDRIDAHVAGSLIDPQAIAAAKHSRLGLLVGALAAAVVIATVLFIVLRSSATQPQSSAATDAAAIDAAIARAADAAALPPLDAAEPAAVDAAVATVDASTPAPPVRRPATFVIRVIARPSTATIHAGAQYLGPSGVAIEKPSGTSLDVECRLAGYRPGKLHLTFDGRRESAVCVLDTRPPDDELLEPSSRWGLFSVTSDPYASIYVDGAKIGDTPLYRVKLSTGKHTVRAVRDDAREQTLPIEIVPGKELNLGKLAW